MLRPVLVVFLVLLPELAWAQQTQPIPDTSGAKARRRQREKEPPPPEGPWGPEEFGLTWLTPVWRGVFTDVESYSGLAIELNTPLGIAGTTDSVSQSLVEKLDWKSEQFRTVGGRVVVDLDMIRLSGGYYSGSFEARARLTIENGSDPAVTEPVLLHGNAFGMRFGAYWPALRYRDSVFEASVGPTLTAGWLHEEASFVPFAPIPMRDTKDILTGSLGPEVSLRTFFGRAAIELDGEYSFTTGAARGWTRALMLGVGYKF